MWTSLASGHINHALICGFSFTLLLLVANYYIFQSDRVSYTIYHQIGPALVIDVAKIICKSLLAETSQP